MIEIAIVAEGDAPTSVIHLMEVTVRGADAPTASFKVDAWPEKTAKAGETVEIGARVTVDASGLSAVNWTLTTIGSSGTATLLTEASRVDIITDNEVYDYVIFVAFSTDARGTFTFQILVTNGNGTVLTDTISVACDSSGDSYTDGDGTPDVTDGCPNEPNKIDPDLCGCGVSDTRDSDGDGTPDCIDSSR